MKFKVMGFFVFLLILALIGSKNLPNPTAVSNSMQINVLKEQQKYNGLNIDQLFKNGEESHKSAINRLASILQVNSSTESLTATPTIYGDWTQDGYTSASTIQADFTNDKITLVDLPETTTNLLVFANFSMGIPNNTEVFAQIHYGGVPATNSAIWSVTGTGTSDMVQLRMTDIIQVTTLDDIEIFFSSAPNNNIDISSGIFVAQVLRSQ